MKPKRRESSLPLSEEIPSFTRFNFFHFIPRFCRATPVTISGRQLLVNGQPFVVKGVDYSPTPIGRTLTPELGCNNSLYEWWTIDRPT